MYFDELDLCKLLKNHKRKISSSQSITELKFVKMLLKYCQKF